MGARYFLASEQHTSALKLSLGSFVFRPCEGLNITMPESNDNTFSLIKVSEQRFLLQSSVNVDQTVQNLGANKFGFGLTSATANTSQVFTLVLDQYGKFTIELTDSPGKFILAGTTAADLVSVGPLTHTNRDYFRIKTSCP